MRWGRRIAFGVLAVLAAALAGQLVSSSLEGQAGPAVETWERDELEAVSGEEYRELIIEHGARASGLGGPVEVLRTPGDGPEVILVTPRDGAMERVHVRADPVTGTLEVRLTGEVAVTGGDVASTGLRDCTLVRTAHGQWTTCYVLEEYAVEMSPESDSFRVRHEADALPAQGDARLLEMSTELRPMPRDGYDMQLAGFSPGSDMVDNCHAPGLDLDIVEIRITALEACEHWDVERERDPRRSSYAWSGDLANGMREVHIEESVRVPGGAEAAWELRGAVTFQCQPRGACAAE